MITVGGIGTKPRYIDRSLRPREMLDVTISVDYAVTDAAAAEQFLADLLILSNYRRRQGGT